MRSQVGLLYHGETIVSDFQNISKELKEKLLNVSLQGDNECMRNCPDSIIAQSINVVKLHIVPLNLCDYYLAI